MKITAGFHTAEDYPKCVEAGADELFCGYVPHEWQLQFGIHSPMNRREVLYSGVQLGSESELQILSDMMKDYRVPVALTLNASYYRPEMYPFLTQYILRCAELGYTDYIVADHGLVLHLAEKDLLKDIRLHLSGEFGELNSYSGKEMKELGVKRLIFHRQVPIPEMKQLIEKLGPEMEYEAFVLNEKCHFCGAYCSSLHCDELPPMCRVAYRLDGKAELEVSERDGIGAGGCGLCAIPELNAAGIDYMKIVGRGNTTENILTDIRSLKNARSIFETAVDETAYRNKMKQTLFPDGCSGNCYYM